MSSWPSMTTRSICLFWRPQRSWVWTSLKAKSGLCIVLLSPSAPDPEAVRAVLAGLHDDDALPRERHLVRLATAPSAQGLRLEAALALHLEVRRPGAQGARVDVGLVLPAAAVDDDRLAPGGQRDPALPGDLGVPQTLSGELRQPLDPLDPPLEVRVEGEQVGGVDGDRVTAQVDHDDVGAVVGEVEQTVAGALHQGRALAGDPVTGDLAHGR